MSSWWSRNTFLWSDCTRLKSTGDKIVRAKQNINVIFESVHGMLLEAHLDNYYWRSTKLSTKPVNRTDNRSLSVWLSRFRSWSIGDRLGPAISQAHEDRSWLDNTLLKFQHRFYIISNRSGKSRTIVTVTFTVCMHQWIKRRSPDIDSEYRL